MNAEIELYEALVDAGVSKDKARNVVLAQKDTMDQILTTLATKTDMAEFRTYVDGRFNLTKTDGVSHLRRWALQSRRRTNGFDDE